MGNTRWVTLGFVALGALTAIVLSKILGAIASVSGITDYAVLGPRLTVSTLIAWVGTAAATLHYYRQEEWNTLGLEIVQELRKVVWPNWDETRSATVVVIITTVIIALILYLFDAVWSGITSWIYT